MGGALRWRVKKMEKEMKKTVNVMETNETVNETAQPKSVVVADVVDGNLLLRREPIKDKNGKLMKTRDGRQLFNYSVNGTIRGRSVKGDFMPRDVGGYEPLDIIFDFGVPVSLICTEETSTDYSGNKITRVTYVAQIVDEGGNVFSCEVKPQRLSDKSLVDMLLNAVK